MFYRIIRFLYLTVFKPFSTNVPLLYSRKKSEKRKFSDVFRGYRSGTVVENGLSHLKFLQLHLWLICVKLSRVLLVIFSLIFHGLEIQNNIMKEQGKSSPEVFQDSVKHLRWSFFLTIFAKFSILDVWDVLNTPLLSTLIDSFAAFVNIYTRHALLLLDFSRYILQS